jgi:dienelactone hydrolase
MDAGATADAGQRADAGSVLDCASAPIACAYPGRRLDLRGRPIEGIEVVDELSGRVLPVLVRAPVGPGPYPVVVFEHGGELRLGAQNGSPEWGDLIASNGYIVVHVGHTPADGSARTLCEATGATVDECKADPSIIYAAARIFDQLATFEDLPAIAEAVAAAGGPEADLERVAVVGWSGGTHASITTLGATRRLSPSAPRFTRLSDVQDAVVLLSPPGVGFHAFFDEGGGDHSWADARGPLLVVTGENDVKPDEPLLVGQLRRDPFDYAPNDGMHRLLYSLLTELGGHTTYNLEDAMAPQRELRALTAAIGSVVLAFLDAHLRADPGAEAYLDSDLPRRLAGEVEWLER